jgi:ABC-type polysaccharide/polyol phosphate transport system ATPase subunit
MPSSAKAPPCIVVENASKAFRLPHERVHSLKERALHPFRRRSFERLEALHEVSLEIAPGEFFGIVGRNGSGKSTLLKCLAGIYRLDSGRITLRGRMAPFIELGVGFNPDLTARDNVVINAIMLGLTPAEARARYDGVIDFAELREFEDLKLKNYSSGMHVRLAFAVMVQVDADILLIDEVLAVGDAAFQQKCYETLDRMRVAGRTILFVSHDMATIERSCDRAMLLERGRLVDVDEPVGIARKYNELNFPAGDLVDGGDRLGDGSAAIMDAWFEDLDGQRVPVLQQGEGCSFHTLVEFRQPLSSASFGFVLLDEHRRTIFTTTKASSEARIGEFSAGERVEFSVRFDNVLASGHYFVSPLISHEGMGSRLIDLRQELVSVAVLGGERGGGIIDLPHESTLRRVDTSPRQAMAEQQQ